ncbi:MAG: methyltransferase [Pseudomonadota bacterium]
MSDQTPPAPGAVDLAALKAALDAGAAALAAGDARAAAEAYARALAIDPEDRAAVSLRLAALAAGPTPDGAPPAYVAALFDQNAADFDDILIERLGYDAPLQIRQQIQDAAGPERRFARLLDLGCGTGLCAEALGDLTEARIGVDLSEGMIAEAAEKELYDALYVGDALGFLRSEIETDASFDLIVAGDLAPYLGDLAPLIGAVAERLAPGGLFALTAETAEGLDGEGDQAADAPPPWRVTPERRFAHASAHLDAALRTAGLERLDARTAVTRYETGRPVASHLVVAARPA